MISFCKVNLEFISRSAFLSLLKKSGFYFEAFLFDEIDKPLINLNTKIDFFIVAPIKVYNKEEDIKILKRKFPSSIWLSFATTIFESNLLTTFDKVFSIYDSHETISNTISDFILNENQTTKNFVQEFLSSREIDVLKLVVAGLSNKEIAEKLFISTHTVISHRKNISKKTGIKSQSGLTIYAIANKIVNLDDYSK